MSRPNKLVTVSVDGRLGQELLWTFAIVGAEWTRALANQSEIAAGGVSFGGIVPATRMTAAQIKCGAGWLHNSSDACWPARAGWWLEARRDMQRARRCSRFCEYASIITVLQEMRLLRGCVDGIQIAQELYILQDGRVGRK